ncbi:MAG: FliA/WhiG family RNA polymerase sigma factor [Thermoguttaceae bacterium]|jgi:RNA polymerase sigma factor for flagellar operon FliA
MVATQSDPEKVARIWQDFIEDRSNQKLRNALIEQYLPLVRYHAERVWSRLPDEVEVDDLNSSGVFGLMDAIDAFDPSRGVKFETYCVPRVRGAMLDELRNTDWVPRLVRSRARKLAEANKELSSRYGRLPTEPELAEYLQIDRSELERIMNDANAINVVSLNKKWFATDGSKDVSEIDLIADKHSEDPTSRLQKSDVIRMVTRGLNRNERMIIILYYYEEMTMKEVGAALDLSESRVSQMHSAIVARLQKQLKKRRMEFVS